MSHQPHDQTELEFAAKRVHDLLRELYPDRDLQFLTFIVDSGSSGYIGYIASARRIDAVRLMGEWLERMLPTFSRTDLLEIIKLLEEEMNED